MPPTTVRLRAVSGTPLDEPIVRAHVIAAAQTLAHREGVRIDHIDTSKDAITLTLHLDRLATVGFLAQLRRETNAWYEAKYRDGPLWGTPKPGDNSHDADTGNTFDDDPNDSDRGDWGKDWQP